MAIKNNSLLKMDKKLAYDLVIKDLLYSLKKAKNGESIRFGSLGSFCKKEQRMRSGLDGNVYDYYKLSFRMGSKLKNAL